MHGSEFMHKEIRHKIYEETKNRFFLLPNVIIETERGNIRIYDFIEIVKEEGNYAGELGLSIAYDIFNFNSAQYLIDKAMNNKIINIKFIKYINYNENENKNLLLLINENQNHFKVDYYNDSELDLNYNPENFILLEENSNKNSFNIKDNLENSSKEKEEKEVAYNNKYKFKDLSNLSFEDIS